MKLTIFAATGGVGRQLLEQAIAAGHDVTAVVRSPEKLAGGGTVRVVKADLAAPDPAALESAVSGADAVLSGLGPRSNADAGIAARGTAAIVAAMQATHVRRIVAVSAAPVGTVPSPGRPRPPRHDPGDGFFMRHLFSPLARAAFGKVYADLARMGDVGARDDPAAPDVLPVRRTVAAGSWLAAQPRWADDGPVQAAVAQDVFHLRQIGVDLAERGPNRGAEQVAHEEPVARVVPRRPGAAR